MGIKGVQRTEKVILFRESRWYFQPTIGRRVCLPIVGDSLCFTRFANLFTT
jgi:hypothetical protein